MDKERQKGIMINIAKLALIGGIILGADGLVKEILFSKAAADEEDYFRPKAVLQGKNWYANKVFEGLLEVRGTGMLGIFRVEHTKEAVMEISQRCQVEQIGYFPHVVEDLAILYLKEGTSCP